MTRHPAKATFLAAIMLFSVFAMAAPAGMAGIGTADAAVGLDDPAQANGGGSPDHAGPPGHAGVPDENVEVTNRGGPGNGNGNGPPDHAAAWGVSASDHASDMDVEVVLDGDSIDYVELTDDRNGEGRNVSVNASALVASMDGVDAVSGLPDRVYGDNSDDGRWSRPLTVKNGSATWAVPHFSTNTVEFSATYSINAAQASNGSTFTFESDGGTDTASIDLTGATNSKWSNVTKTAVGNGEQVTLDVGGNVDPAGPSANGKPVVEITGRTQSEWNPMYDEGNGYSYSSMYAIGDREGHGSDEYHEAEMGFNPDHDFTFSTLEFGIKKVVGNSYDPDVDIRVVQGPVDGTFGGGTRVKNSWNPTMDGGNERVELDSSYSVTAGTQYHIEVSSNNIYSNNDQDEMAISHTYGSSASSQIYDKNQGMKSEQAYVKIGEKPSNGVGIDVGGDGTTDAEVIGDIKGGETVTVELPLSASDNSAAISVNEGAVDMTYKIKERTQTNSPELDLNGNTMSHAGTLGDGETTTLNPDVSWVQNGSNTLTLETTSPSAGPKSLASFDYSHNATVDKSVDVNASAFREKYQFSRTWNEPQAGAETQIPFTSDSVVGVKDVSTTTSDATSTTTNDNPTYNWNRATNELDVQLGDVAAGETTTVSADATKIDEREGTVTVTDPTTPGNPITSTIRPDTVGTDGMVRVGVGSTQASPHAYYVTESGWQHDDRMRFDATGDEELLMPNAEPGRNASLRTFPLSATPASGNVSVKDFSAANGEPKFTVADDSQADTSFTYYEAETGEYELYDLTTDTQLDTGEANSPVTLTANGDMTGHVLVIRPWTAPAAAGPAPLRNDGGISIPLGSLSLDGIPTVAIPLFLLGILGVGGLLVRRQTSTSATGSGRTRGSIGGIGVPGGDVLGGVVGAVGGAARRIPLSGIVGRVGRGLIGVVKAVGLPLKRLVVYLGRWLAGASQSGAQAAGGWLTARLATPAIALGVIAFGVMISIRLGIISPAQEVRLLLAAVSALIGSAVALRAVGLLNWKFYSVVGGATFLIAAEAIAPGSILPRIGAGIEEAFPIIALVGAYLLVRRFGGGGSGSGGSSGSGSSGGDTTVVITDDDAEPSSSGSD